MKTIIKLLEWVFLFGCLILIFSIWYKCSHKKLSPKQVEHIEKANIEQINEIKNAKEDTTWHEIINSVVHAKKSVAVGNLSQLNTSFQKEIKDVAKKDKIKENQIDNSTSFTATVTTNTESHGSFLDSLDNKILEFPIKDTCSGGYVIVDVNKMDMMLHQVSHFSVQATLHWDKIHDVKQLIRLRFKKFFSDKKYTEDISSDCPNIHIDSISTLKIIKGFQK